MKVSNKREEITNAALELIAEHGFHGAPMAMIARKARVGAGTIYRYFPSKDVLISELYLELEDRILNAVTAGYSSDGQSTEKLFLHLGTALLKYFINNPLDYRYMEQYHNSPYGVTIRRDRMRGKSDNKGLLKSILEQGTKNKDIKDLPQFIQIALAMGPLFILARDHVLGLTQLDDDLINKTIRASWDSIRI